jgi:hypothetical protein
MLGSLRLWDVVSRGDVRSRPVALHQKITSRGGAFLEMGTPVVTVRGGYALVDVPLAFEKEDVSGRVASNADAQVAGFFVLPSESR